MLLKIWYNNNAAYSSPISAFCVLFLWSGDVSMSNIRKKYTVLLLSAPIGSGHRLAAEALREALSEQADVEVVHGNVFDFFPHFLQITYLSLFISKSSLNPSSKNPSGISFTFVISPSSSIFKGIQYDPFSFLST